MIIGLTGGMGSGKSTVAARLAEHGCLVLDADAIYKELTHKGSPLVMMLEEEFGRDIADEEHELIRANLSKAAFASPENVSRLNEITHEAVKDEMRKRTEASDKKYIVWDVPLLFESGSNHECDEVWSVIAPLKDRLQRIVLRDDITEEEALSRISHQMSDDERILLSDVVINNDSDYEALNAKVDQRIKERLEL